MTLEEAKKRYMESHAAWPYLDDEVALVFYRAGQEKGQKSMRHRMVGQLLYMAEAALEDGMRKEAEALTAAHETLQRMPLEEGEG